MLRIDLPGDGHPESGHLNFALRLGLPSRGYRRIRTFRCEIREGGMPFLPILIEKRLF